MSELARARERSGRRVIRLSQAVPWYGPPDWALDAVVSQLHDSSIHRYSADPGMPDVRDLVCTRWLATRGLSLDPGSQIHLTCGASQAFLSALTVVADPGQSVVLTDPYYFDHLFAAQFLALSPRFVPMHEDETGFRVDVDGLVEEIRAGCAAVVLVDPANPTGSVVPQDDVRRIAEECVAAGAALVIDETYERITFGPRKTWHPLQDSSTRDATLVVGSFSKSLGMAGWRLGYLLGPESLLQQALKVQDSVAICAPVIAQVLLREALRGPFDEWVDARLDEIRRRRSIVEEALGDSPFWIWRPVEGGIFSLMGYSSDMTSLDAATEVLRETGVVLVPGSAFGCKGQGHLRLSFGSPDIEELACALDLLRQTSLGST